MNEQEVITLHNLVEWVEDWIRTCSLNDINPKDVPFYIENKNRRYRPFAGSLGFGNKGASVRIEYFDSDILLFDEIILQQRSADDCSLYLNSKENECISVLLDASGGEGIDTPIKILEGRKVGYAGGISPDNVAEKLTYLYEHTEGDFWIDMESGVRTDDWFDLDKVVKVLEICQPIIDRYEKEEE